MVYLIKYVVLWLVDTHYDNKYSQAVTVARTFLYYELGYYVKRLIIDKIIIDI